VFKESAEWVDNQNSHEINFGFPLSVETCDSDITETNREAVIFNKQPELTGKMHDNRMLISIVQ